MTEPYIITLDAGTTGVKCSAFTRDGRALFSRVEAYDTYYPHPSWAQQKPEEQLSAALRAVRALTEALDPAAAQALGLTGTMNGCIPIDTEGNALYPNIIHSDNRTAEQADRTAQLIPLMEFYRVTGNRIDVHAGLPKYMWLKEHEPEVYARAWKFVNIKDYLYGHFTGHHGCTDRSDAGLCNCLDLSTGDWAWEILRTLGVDTNKMPTLMVSTDVSGRLLPEFAAQMNLPAGLPVAVGGGDGACAAHGARRHVAGDAYMNIGSSAWVSAMSPAPVLDKEARLFNYHDLDGVNFNVCGTVQCGSAASNWAIENLIYPGTRVQDCDFAALEALARTAPAGADGVMFLPTLMGERTPWWTARCSGTLIGFSQFHEPRHIARAVYEGVMQALNLCGDILRENDVPISALTLIGGGAKSLLWGELAASMFGAEVRIHATPHEATALGTAMAAGMGIGWYQSWAEASECIHVRKVYTPNAKDNALYQKHLAVYRTLYPQMKGAYEALYRFQQELNPN